MIVLFLYVLTIQYQLESVIDEAKITCENSDLNVNEQFANVGKLSKRSNNATVEITDYKLSRYACYLIVLNCDPRKKVIATLQFKQENKNYLKKSIMNLLKMKKE